MEIPSGSLFQYPLVELKVSVSWYTPRCLHCLWSFAYKQQSKIRMRLQRC